MWRTVIHCILVSLAAAILAGGAVAYDQLWHMAAAPHSASDTNQVIAKLPIKFSGEWQRQNLNSTRPPLKARTDIQITYQDESGKVKGLLSSYAVGTTPPGQCGSIVNVAFEGTWDGATLAFATVNPATPCEKRTYVLTLGKKEAKEPYFKGVSASDPSWSVWYDPVKSFAD